MPFIPKPPTSKPPAPRVRSGATIKLPVNKSETFEGSKYTVLDVYRPLAQPKDGEIFYFNWENPATGDDIRLDNYDWGRRSLRWHYNHKTKQPAEIERSAEHGDFIARATPKNPDGTTFLYQDVDVGSHLYSVGVSAAAGQNLYFLEITFLSFMRRGYSNQTIVHRYVIPANMPGGELPPRETVNALILYYADLVAPGRDDGRATVQQAAYSRQLARDMETFLPPDTLASDILNGTAAARLPAIKESITKKQHSGLLRHDFDRLALDTPRNLQVAEPIVEAQLSPHRQRSDTKSAARHAVA